MQLEIDGNRIFAPLKDKWVKNSAEERLKQEFILRLINNYGYSIEQLGQDVELQKRYKADIAIWRSAVEKKQNHIPSIIIAVECKPENIKINESEYSIGYNVASNLDANFFIAVNLRETKVYHLRRDEAPKKYENLSDIPRADILSDGKRIDRYVRESKAFTREQFSRMLTRCHNIIRNNDKLSPEAAFDEISKILFMKIMYERDSKGDMIFSKARFQADEKSYEQIIRPNLRVESKSFDQDYMQYLFDRTKREFETDGIFEPKDQIRIKRNSFEMIVEELEPFSLSDTSDDIKGIAFEQFLGKTFRGELGQFFTPRSVVDFMVKILDPKEGETICDPCCGSGGFLISAFEYVKNQIDVDIRRQIGVLRKSLFPKDFEQLSTNRQNEAESNAQEIMDALHAEFDLKTLGTRYYDLSHKCIFGVDANPRMARTAKMNMIMHGDGHGGVHHNDGLLNVNGVFEGRFDVILTNPPFGSRVEKSTKITKKDVEVSAENFEKLRAEYGDAYETAYSRSQSAVGKPLLELFDTGSMSSLTEVLFIERCLNLLRPGGRMGIVLPEGVLNNTNLQKIRDYVEHRARILFIVSIPLDVFAASGASVKPSILFLEKFTTQDEERWKTISKEAIEAVCRRLGMSRQLFLNSLDDFAFLFGVRKEGDDRRQNFDEHFYQEVRREIRTRFNYQILFAEVEKAGISSTGMTIENELDPLLEEFEIYRRDHKLWSSVFKKYDYLFEGVEVKRTVSIVRTING